MRRKNERLRDQIAQVVEKDPELRGVTEGIALRQDLHVEVGTPFLERTQGKLRERARATIERRPDDPERKGRFGRGLTFSQSPWQRVIPAVKSKG